MLEALKSAERFIFLEYFIIERGVMWDSVLEILTEKVKFYSLKCNMDISAATVAYEGMK